MALTINTNLTALNAQRNLNNTQSTLNKSMQRLSTGLRINSAKDDAAGLAISNRMDSQVRGMNQAARNANDAISLAQTAEGAMNEVTSLLQRMREISVQASNATYSDSDRASLQNEMDQFFEEIDRIADSTTFNGISLLDGTSGTRTIQVGAQSGETVSMTLGSIKTGALHLNGYSAAGELNSGRVGTVTTAGLTINDVDIASAAATTAESAATAINAKTSLTGVSATAYNIVEGNGNVSGITSGLTINSDTVADSGSIEELVENINRDVSGVTATLNSEGGVTLTNDTGANIVIGGTADNSGLDDTFNNGAGAGIYTGYLALTDDNNEAIEITATGGTTANLNGWGFNASTGSDSVTGGTVTSGALAAKDLLINGVDVGAVTGTSAGDKAAAINAISDQTGVTASAETSQEFTLNFGVTPDATAITINGTAVDLSTVSNLEQVIDEINGKVQGVVASAGEGGELVLTSASGLDIDVAEDTTLFLGTGATDTYSGQITLESSNGGDVVITGENTAYAGFAEQGGADAVIGSGLSVGTVANANVAIERIDDALNNIATQRGNLGAIQNRLDSTISNLGSVAENLTAANSRILDADFASETAAMTKAQIMTQAGTAMLAQANQLPQTVLSLLQ
jgi:flagellin